MTASLKGAKSKITGRLRQKLASNSPVLSLTSLSSSYGRSIQPSTIKDGGYWKDCVYYMIHRILEKQKYEDFKAGSKFVALQFDLLKKVLGDETKIVIDTLVKNRLIICDDKYAKGKTPFGYKITPSYLAQGTSFKTLTDKKICRRYHKFQKQYIEEQRKLLHDKAHLVKWLMEGKLTFLNGLAIDYIELLKNDVLKYFQTYHRKVGTGSISDMLAESIFWSTVEPQENVVTFDEVPSISKKGLRMYSGVTAMYSPLRNLLLHDNVPMVYVDISNSQPFHFLAVLRSSFWKPAKSKSSLCLQNLNRELYSYLRRKYTIEMNNTIMTLENAESRRKSGYIGRKSVVFRKSSKGYTFPHLVMNGNLYKFVCAHFSGQFNGKGGDPFGDEKAAKQSFIEMLYFNDKAPYSTKSKHFKLFSSYFPLESTIIKLLKSRDYRDFSIMLQHIESNLLLDHVCKEIFNLNPSIPMYTIHDGILTPIHYEDDLTAILEDVYKERMGVIPEFTVEHLRPSNLTSKVYVNSVIKKAKKIAEDNKLAWHKPSPEFILNLQTSYGPFYDRIKDIPSF